MLDFGVEDFRNEHPGLLHILQIFIAKALDIFFNKISLYPPKRQKAVLACPALVDVIAYQEIHPSPRVFRPLVDHKGGNNGGHKRRAFSIDRPNRSSTDLFLKAARILR